MQDRYVSSVIGLNLSLSSHIDLKLVVRVNEGRTFAYGIYDVNVLLATPFVAFLEHPIEMTSINYLELSTFTPRPWKILVFPLKADDGGGGFLFRGTHRAQC